ncbi:MAG: type II secretion system secretin GspD [Gammaproteobacteria bacterium]|nr:type II secretion system secretin GspD [Gammaproteobacteria bacterium]
MLLKHITHNSKQILLCLALSLGSFSLQAAEKITLNLQDADIRALITTVSKFTGKNFVIDPRIKAKVTVVSNKSMNKKQVYEVFLSILQVHGFAAVELGTITKIVPEVNAKQGALKITSAKSPGVGDELVTQIIQLNHVPAAQLVPILRPLIPQQGHLAAYNPTNALIITDHAANIQRLLKIIAEVDQANNNELEIIKLENASATEMVRILNALQDKTNPKDPSAVIKFAADERTNSILISGDRSERLRIRATISHLDTPLEDGGNTLVIYLHYANAEDLVKILTGLDKSSSTAARAAPKAGAKSNLTIKTNIQFDEATNAIIVTASPDEMRNIKSIIRQLDIRRAQVLIESIIAEISYAQAEGVAVGLVNDTTGSDNPDSPVLLSNFAGIGGLLAGGAGAAAAIGEGLTVGVGSETPSGNRFGLLLTALGSDASTNVLSTPSIVTLDNEAAEILIGDEIPVLTGSYSSTGTSSTPTNPFQTIERKDVGITLKVKPQINEGNTIRLELEQEVSSLSETTEAGPVTNKRTIKTSVLVENEEILVLGGLVQDRVLDNFDSVPVLGDIPLLGRLFQSQSSSKVKQNLMVFMRPSILRDINSANLVTNRKYNYMRAQQMQAKDKGYGLLEKSAPLLPELMPTATTPAPATDELTPALPDNNSELAPESKIMPAPNNDSASSDGE